MHLQGCSARLTQAMIEAPDNTHRVVALHSTSFRTGDWRRSTTAARRQSIRSAKASHLNVFYERRAGDVARAFFGRGNTSAPAAVKISAPSIVLAQFISVEGDGFEMVRADPAWDC
jgi:hypothetical protein